jgi:glutathione-regulated potassium-efflux system protein KefB
VHTLELIAKGVHYEVRETYESALAFGRHTLEEMGLDPERAAEIEAEVRRRDIDRLALQQAGDIYAGAELMPYHTLPHEPLSDPKRRAVPLNEETADVISHETEFSG